MGAEHPLVTIIVRTKDRPKLLKRALQSIAAQIYRPIEAVVVNDGGCDLDVEELRNILGEVSLNYIKLDRNMGRSHAGNVGIDNARGKYVGFLDDDDEFYPEHVSILTGYLEQSDLKVAYTDSFMVYRDYDPQTREIGSAKRELVFSQDFNYDFLIFENFIPFMCLLFTMDVLVNSGGFDTDFDLYEDWDLLIRVGERTPFYHIKKITANYNQWDSNLQISQRNRDYRFIEQSYQRVLAKHVAKINEKSIRSYISQFVRARDALKELRSKSDSLENSLAEKAERITTREHLIENLEAVIKHKDDTIGALKALTREEASSGESPEAIIRDKDATIDHLDAIIRNKQSCIENLDAIIRGKDTTIVNLETALGNKDSCIENLDAIIRDKDATIVDLYAAMRNKEAYTEHLNTTIRDRDCALEDLRAAMREKDAALTDLESAMREKDAALTDLESAMREKDAALTDLESAMREKDAALTDLESAMREKDASLEGLEAAVRDLREKEVALNNVYNSNGWRALLIYYRIRDKILPPNSRRRLFVKLLITAVTNPRGLLKNLTRENLRKFLNQYQILEPSILESKVKRKTSFSFDDRKVACAPPPGEVRFEGGLVSQGPPAEKNRVLVIDRFLPTYDKDSGSLRMYSLLGILRDLGYKVTFLPDDLQKTEPYTGDLQKMGIEVLYGNVDVEKYLERMGPVFSVVIISRPEQMFKYISLVRAYAINSTVVYDTVDLHWVRFERAASTTGDPDALEKARVFKRMELFNASCSDMVFTITDDEKDMLLKEIPELEIEVMPNIHEVVRTERPFEKRKGIMFIGGFLHQPNEDAVFYFLRDILPLIRKKVGDMKFFVVGSDPSPAMLRLNSGDVVVTGYVRDVTPHFEGCRVFVSPLRYGAGMKGKIGQSMAYGLPVVTTTVGAEGMGLIDGETALIADEPGAFAEAVIRLYTDESLWNGISQRSVEHIEKNYSREAVSKIVETLFESLKQEAPAHEVSEDRFVAAQATS